ncbi:YdaU family protein [Castellaniella sp. UC4442_H9]
MNYYEHHLGDYAKDTGHLSMLEHGAYRILLDRYYSTERGIPADQAYRLARARSDEECRAVDAVLEEFFELVDGVWIQGRVERELVAANKRIVAAQENGKKGGRPPKKPKGSDPETQQKPDGLLPGSDPETQQKAHQAPSTKHHLSKEEEAAAAHPPRGRIREAPSAAPPAGPEVIDPHGGTLAGPPAAIPDEAPKRATQLAVLLRRNGADPRTLPNDRRIAEWVRDGVTDAEALRALETAKARRKDQGSDQPIGTAYLAPIIADIRAAPLVSPASKPAAAAQDQWWRSDAGVDRKARELGMFARPSEDYASFKDRIFETLRQRESQGARA